MRSSIFTYMYRPYDVNRSDTNVCVVIVLDVKAVEFQDQASIRMWENIIVESAASRVREIVNAQCDHYIPVFTKDMEENAISVSSLSGVKL